MGAKPEIIVKNGHIGMTEKKIVRKHIEILNCRMNAIFQMINLSDEYNEIKSSINCTGFDSYFEAMYSYVDRYIVLELERINEDCSDCVSIKNLKAIINKSFNGIFPKANADIYGHKYCNISLEEFRIKQKEIFNHDIQIIQKKISDIRNKFGLAHGQEEKFDILVTREELHKLRDAYKEFLWMVDERLNNSHFAYGEGIIKQNGLFELVKYLHK